MLHFSTSLRSCYFSHKMNIRRFLSTSFLQLPLFGVSVKIMKESTINPFRPSIVQFSRFYSNQDMQNNSNQKNQKNQNNNADDENATYSAASQFQISNWLFGCCGIVALMVVVGGVTRLTRSGLSMVEWKPLGHLPPMNEQEWNEEFEKYKLFPEYKSLGREMKMREFKFIYAFEYAHRMLGRVLGVVFAVPFVYFLSRRQISRNLGFRLSGLFALGGLQGAVGWWMVSSGLDAKKHSYNDLPRVSPYRLATHLISAFIIFAGLFHTALRVRTFAKFLRSRLAEEILLPLWFQRASSSLKYLVGATVFSGAFVAGNEAGLGYNDFPLMGGQIIPDHLFLPDIPVFKNFFENSVMVQFQHRYLGMSTAAACVSLMYLGLKLNLPAAIRSPLRHVGYISILQMLLGIITLIHHIPVPLAAIHQAGSLALFSSALWLVWQ